jgi:hypothetical protein
MGCPNYCVSNTGSLTYNDYYIMSVGSYNGINYYIGESNGNFIYFISGDTSQWCLSSSLGGSCFLSGKSPCNNTCPDLSSLYFSEGICPTPSPTPTSTPTVNNYDNIFISEYLPYPESGNEWIELYNNNNFVGEFKK